MFDRTALGTLTRMDPLSRVMSLITVLEARPSRLRASGDWSLRYPGTSEVSFGHVRDGEVWAVTSSGRWHVTPGDCFVHAGGDPLTLASDPDRAPTVGALVCARNADGTAVIGDGDMVCVEGGQIALDQAGAQLLFDVLPSLTVLRAGAAVADEVRAGLHRFFTEADSDRLGSTLIAAHLGQIVCVAALRAAIGEDDQGQGWLAALADPVIGPAVHAMHADPGRPWTVTELAKLAHLTRSSFSARYRTLTGEAPLAHVLRLRMRVAAREVRAGDRSIAAIARELGYSSDASFSRAFKRTTGLAPGRFRADAQRPSTGVEDEVGTVASSR
jgi:AraC-like DNA-binding protein